MELEFILYLVVMLVGSLLSLDRIQVDKNYKKNARPSNKTNSSAPLLVEAVLNLRNIIGISEPDQQISLEITFKMYWTDPRIGIKNNVSIRDGNDEGRGQYVLAPPGFEQNMWIPDVFIDKAINIRIPKFYQQPSSVRVYESSLIRYAARINFDIACRMNFRKYPADQQKCLVQFESFSYVQKDLRLEWAASGLNLPDFKSTAQYDFHVELGTADTKYNQAFPALFVRIHLIRMIMFHLAQTYMPSILFVILGWMVLLLPVEAVPGRVGLGALTLLALTTMNSAVRSRLPQVSYLTYMDIWVGSCTLFLFLINAASVGEIALFKIERKRSSVILGKSSLILFPVVFAIFNCVYWPVLMEAIETVDSH